MNEGATCCSHRETEQSNKKAIFRDFRVFRGQKIELINKEPGS
jgi:hypothetical protein